MNQPHISELRRELLATIREVRSGQMEPERARAISLVASELIDTARVEVDYLKMAGGDCSNFIDDLKAPDEVETLPAGKRQIKTGMVRQIKGVGLVHTSGDDED